MLSVADKPFFIDYDSEFEYQVRDRAPKSRAFYSL